MTAHPRRKAELPEEKSKALLLAAAKKLFAREGFQGTTVRDIAQEAGVNLSLVSYYFQGKEGLYRACLEQFGQARLEAVERMIQPVESTAELRLRLKMAVEEILRIQIAEPEIAQIVHREIEQNLPVAQEIFEKTFLKIFQAWVRFFADAKAKGFLRPEVDPVILAQVIQGSLNYFVRVDAIRARYFNHSIRDEVHRDQLIENFVTVFLCGSLKPTA